jgi:hypothetical protein
MFLALGLADNFGATGATLLVLQYPAHIVGFLRKIVGE